MSAIYNFVADPAVNNVVQTGLLALTAGTVWSSLRALRQNSQHKQLDTYFQLSREYRELKESLPEGFFSEETEPELTGKQVKLPEKMLEFFAIEHNFYEDGHIPEAAWEIMRIGMVKFGFSKVGQRAFKEALRDEHCDIPEGFLNFYNDMMLEVTKRRREEGIDPVKLKSVDYTTVTQDEIEMGMVG